MALTKADITADIQEKLKLSNAKSSKTIEILLEIIKRNLESGEDVMISGFGKFCVKKKKERKEPGYRRGYDAGETASCYI